jgi:ribose transport system ATP-binding protein
MAPALDSGNQIDRMPPPEPLLQVTGLRKSYNVPVLVDFDFQLQPGEVHALVGSNGAGKSTFARILSGLTQPDAGEMKFSGQPHTPRSKREAEQAGIIMVLQELNVLGTLTVAENIFLSRLPNRAGWIRGGELREAARKALARVGLGDVDPTTPAGSLGVGHQQMIELAGALSRNCKLLILDEPTAALTDPEIARLFENIRTLQAQGVGIIYVSHRMDEIKRIADRITVMRDGRRISTITATEATPEGLIRMMVGHDLPLSKKASPAPSRPSVPALSIRKLCAGSLVRDVSFEVNHNEIVGIAGLIGSGRTETLRAIFGADGKASGEILVNGKAVSIHNPSDAVRLGIGLVPEDRKQHGLLLPQSVRVNTTLATLTLHARSTGYLNTASETATTGPLCERMKVRCASLEQPVGELSGGNQQKIVIARWLARDCQILLFDEPTRGIDVAAKDLIYQLLRELAASGKAVVMVSSELTELMALCDRLLVMSAGRITAQFTPDQWTQEKITQAAFRGHLDQKPGVAS